MLNEAEYFFFPKLACSKLPLEKKNTWRNELLLTGMVEFRTQI